MINQLIIYMMNMVIHLTVQEYGYFYKLHIYQEYFLAKQPYMWHRKSQDMHIQTITYTFILYLIQYFQQITQKSQQTAGHAMSHGLAGLCVCVIPVCLRSPKTTHKFIVSIMSQCCLSSFHYCMAKKATRLHQTNIFISWMSNVFRFT